MTDALIHTYIMHVVDDTSPLCDKTLINDHFDFVPSKTITLFAILSCNQVTPQIMYCIFYFYVTVRNIMEIYPIYKRPCTVASSSLH